MTSGKVFAKLDEMHATVFGYAGFRLDEGVSFIHVVVQDAEAGAVSLADLPAFQEFQAGISDQPVAMRATLVGAHRRFGVDRGTGARGVSHMRRQLPPSRTMPHPPTRNRHVSVSDHARSVTR
jgi:hypothetical protein